MPATLEEKIDPKSHEIHVGLDIPRATARQIHRWAREQSWPEGTQLEEPREYHVTLLYSTEGREHKDAWWIEHLERAEVRLKGLTAFPAQEKGYAYVLLLDAPEVAQKAQEMQEKAEAHGLPITQFDGGYKPHITVAYGPSNRLSGIKAPEFQFDIGPSSVSPARPKKSGFGPRIARRPQPHINRHTGLPCLCGWGGHSHRVPMLRTGGLNVRKMLKDPAKAYRTPEGEAFRQHVKRLTEESQLEGVHPPLTDLDPIVPYLANRFRKGDIRLQQRATSSPDVVGPMQLHRAPLSPHPDEPWKPIEHRLPQWTQFVEARQHPLRRGVDVMHPQFAPTEMDDRVTQHQQALQEAQKRQRWLSQYGPESDYPPETVHRFGPEAGKYKGWNVVHLDPYQAEGDSDALGHCIGQDGQPYKHNIDIGNIHAYSLRDPEGYPHVSWHINPSGGSIGHMQGKSGSPNEAYRGLITHFNQAHNLPDVDEGEEELEPQYDPYFSFPEATDQDEFMTYHHPEHMYDFAYENGNVGEDTQFDWQTPDYDSIAEEYLNHGPSSNFHDILRNGAGLYRENPAERFAQALHANFDPQEPTHHESVGYWNSEMARGPGEYVDTPPLEVNNVQDYYEGVDNSIPVHPDWDNIAQDYLEGGREGYGYYHNPHNGPNHYFHQSLDDQSHTDEMHQALMENMNWNNPDHQEAIQNWNNYPGHHHHQINQPEAPPEPSPPGQLGLWGTPEAGGGVFGHSKSRQSSAPPKPPNYRKQDKPSEHCGNCKMAWKGECWGFGMFKIQGDHVCDDWYPESKRSAYNPEEVQILDHLSLQNVAANLHYKFEEGGMDALGATDYAKRLLKLIGYPEDEITVQAALQAWQKMYPEDRLLEGGVTPKITMAIGPEHPDYDPYYDEMVEGWHRDQIPLYHTAPSAVREQILREGLKVADPNAPGNEPGVYVEGDPGMVKDYWGGYKGITDRDIWQIDQRHVKRLMPDYRGQAAYIPHDVPPEALTLHTEGGSPEKFAASRRDLTYSFSPLFGDTAFGKDSAVRYTGGDGQVFGVRPGDNRPLAGGGNRSTAFGWEPRQSPSGGTHQTGQGQTSGAHSQSSLRTRSYGFDAPAGETSQFAREVLGPWESKGVVALHNEDPDKLHLHTVELPSDLRGQGYGHRFMNHVKAYSDAHGKPLVIDPVTNPQFFNQFDWLTPNQQQTRYEYSPEGSSTIPSEVNSPEDHWPDVGGADSPRDHGVQVSNEWVYTN